MTYSELPGQLNKLYDVLEIHMKLMTEIKNRVERLEQRLEIFEGAQNGTIEDKKSGCKCLAVPVS